MGDEAFFSIRSMGQSNLTSASPTNATCTDGLGFLDHGYSECGDLIGRCVVSIFHRYLIQVGLSIFHAPSKWQITYIYIYTKRWVDIRDLHTCHIELATE